MAKKPKQVEPESQGREADKTLPRYRARIQGSSMPWVHATKEEARDLQDRYGKNVEVILVPTP